MSVPPDDVTPSGPRTVTAPADQPPARARRAPAVFLAGAAIVAGAVIISVLVGQPTDTPDPAISEQRRDAFPGESISERSVETTADQPVAASAADEPGLIPIAFDIIDPTGPLRTIAPTEIVTLSSTGTLVEISLPSGRVRTTDLRWPTAGADLVTTDFGALVWPDSTSEGDAPAFTIIAEGEQPLPVIGAPDIEHVSSTPRRDEFVVWPEETDTPRTVTSDGTIAALDADASPNRNSMDPDGGVLDEGTGGLYRVDGSDSRLLSTGDLIAVGRNHVLVHECDSIRMCRLVRIGGSFEGSGTQLRDSTILTNGLSSDHPIWAATPNGLSPDGRALLTFSNATLAIVTVDDGAVTPVHASATGDIDAAWASDSSGVFLADGSLRYFHRADESTSVISDDWPDLRVVTTRPPRRSAACELGIAAAAHFAAMRASDDVAEPSGQLFVGLREFGPADLVDDIDDLATFVGAFVSAGRANSQRIENWPANVRSGVMAIDDFVGTNCG